MSRKKTKCPLSVTCLIYMLLHTKPASGKRSYETLIEMLKESRKAHLYPGVYTDFFI